DGCSGFLVFGDGLEGLATDAAIDPGPDGYPEKPKHERDRIEIDFFRKLQCKPGVANGSRRETQGPARQIACRNDREHHHLTQCQRDQCEVMTDDFETKAWIANDQSEQG